MHVSRGFTMIEMLVTIAIIAIIAGTAFLNYASFASRSLLRVRVAELGEYIRYIQDISGSAKIFPSNSPPSTIGFHGVRIKVRDGKLETFHIEESPGEFLSLANFAPPDTSSFSDSNRVSLQPNENYFIDACFIDVDTTSKYPRRSIVIGNDDACASQSMLCGPPDPTHSGYDADAVSRNNFDIHFSIEQPTREVHANLIPVLANEVHEYDDAIPNGPFSRISDAYDGLRVIFITKEGEKRGIDVYQTGLVSYIAASDSNCEVPQALQGCEGKSINACEVEKKDSGQYSGSCASGYNDGSCSYRCDDGTWRLHTLNTCRRVCLGRSQDWGDRATCQGYLPKTAVSTSAVRIDSESPNTVGHAVYDCNNSGEWVNISYACEPENLSEATCESTELSWTVGENTCVKTVEETPAGQTVLLRDRGFFDGSGRPNMSGLAFFSCYNERWVLDFAQECRPIASSSEGYGQCESDFGTGFPDSGDITISDWVLGTECISLRRNNVTAKRYQFTLSAQTNITGYVEGRLHIPGSAAGGYWAIYILNEDGTGARELDIWPNDWRQRLRYENNRYVEADLLNIMGSVRLNPGTYILEVSAVGENNRYDFRKKFTMGLRFTPTGQ